MGAFCPGGILSGGGAFCPGDILSRGYFVRFPSKTRLSIRILRRGWIRQEAASITGALFGPKAGRSGASEAAPAKPGVRTGGTVSLTLPN